MKKIVAAVGLVFLTLSDYTYGSANNLPNYKKWAHGARSEYLVQVQSADIRKPSSFQKFWIQSYFKEGFVDYNHDFVIESGPVKGKIADTIYVYEVILRDESGKLLLAREKRYILKKKKYIVIEESEMKYVAGVFMKKREIIKQDFY